MPSRTERGSPGISVVNPEDLPDLSDEEDSKEKHKKHFRDTHGARRQTTMEKKKGDQATKGDSSKKNFTIGALGKEPT